MAAASLQSATASSPTVPASGAQPRRGTSDSGPLGSDPPFGRQSGVRWIGVGAAVVLAASPLAHGYFDFAVWGALELGALVLVLVLLRVRRPALSRAGAIALTALAALLALSAASLLWAESREAAWTSVNRVATYCTLFVRSCLLSVREAGTGRLVMLVMGSSALIAAAWVCGSMLFGTLHGAFEARRLDAPIGYINGTAGLLAMGLWPWLACAESPRARVTSTVGVAAMSLIASMLVLTESRVVIPGAIIAANVRTGLVTRATDACHQSRDRVGISGRGAAVDVACVLGRRCTLALAAADSRSAA